MITVTRMLKLKDEKLEKALNTIIQEMNLPKDEIKLINSPYTVKTMDLAGLSGSTFDFLARIRIAKKIGCTNTLDIIGIPYMLVEEMKENGLQNIDSQNNIDINWFISRFEYIKKVLDEYLLNNYDIRSEIIQIGFDLACMESVYRHNGVNEFLYQEVPSLFRADMILMLKNFNNEFIQKDTILTPSSVVIFNPVFGSVFSKIQADGDIIIDGCLIELKTRKRMNLSEDIKQLMIYVALNKLNFKNKYSQRMYIEKIGSYNPRFKGFYEYSLDKINEIEESILIEYLENKRWINR